MRLTPTTFGMLPCWREVSQDGLILIVMAVVAVGSGFGINRFRREPLPLIYLSKTDRLQRSVVRLADSHPDGGISAPTLTRPSAEPETIDLARFHDLLENGSIVLDARPELFYRVGHVPGARSLSRAAFESDYARLRAFLEPHRAQTLVIYCAGDECEDSRMVASALQKLGYPQVLIFAGGWDEWRQAGLPEERP